MTSHKEQPAVDTSAEAGMLAALRECQSALAMMIAPDAIKQTSVLNAFVQATEAEAQARAAIAKATEGRSLAAHPAEPAAKKHLADWSRLPKNMYVVDAVELDDGIGYDATLCSVPMITAPEVRYVRADLISPHPAEPAGMELETTAEERAGWNAFLSQDPARNRLFDDAGLRLLRDFDRMRARAEKAEARSAALEETQRTIVKSTSSNWRAQVETLEAKLAALKQPVSDEEVEEMCDKLDAFPYEQAPVATVMIRQLAHERDALSTQLRDAQARGKGMEEDWQPIETAPKDGTPILAWMLWYPHGLHGREEYAERNFDILRWTTFNGGGWVHYIMGQPTHWMHLPPSPDAALSRPEAWTPTHRHANGGLYRLLPVEFHWEPEWDRPAVLYENDKGVQIGRFADVFAERFTPLSRPEGSAST